MIIFLSALCKDDANGNVPLGKSCNRYWACQGGYPRLQRCPAMLVFDKNRRRCVTPPTEDCEVPTTKAPPPGEENNNDFSGPGSDQVKTSRLSLVNVPNTVFSLVSPSSRQTLGAGAEHGDPKRPQEAGDNRDLRGLLADNRSHRSPCLLIFPPAQCP